MIMYGWMVKGGGKNLGAGGREGSAKESQAPAHRLASQGKGLVGVRKTLTAQRRSVQTQK